jgi:hypothetical protein
VLRPDFSQIIQQVNLLSEHFYKQRSPVNLEIQIPSSTRESVYKRRGTLLMLEVEETNRGNEDMKKRKKSNAAKRKPIPTFQTNDTALSMRGSAKISRESNLSIMNSFKASRMANINGMTIII